MAARRFASESRSFEFLDWQPAFEAAIEENERTRSRDILQKAKTAIFLRLKDMATRPPGVVERIALNDAIHLLRVLRSESSRTDGSKLEHPRRLR